MVEKGPAGLTHRHVAERAGVPMGSTTYYFASLDELRRDALTLLRNRAAADLCEIADDLAVAGAEPAVLGRILFAYVDNTERVRADAAMYAAALRGDDLRDLTLTWFDGPVDVPAEHTGRRTAVALAVFVDGAVLHALLHEQLLWAIKNLAKHHPEVGFANPTGWAALAAGVVLLTWFTLCCLHQPAPMLDVRLFTRRAFTAGTLTALASMFAMFALLLLGAQWLPLVEGLSPLSAGVHLLPMALGGAVTSVAAPTLARQLGTRTVLAGGLAVAGLGFLLLHLAPSPLNYGWVAVALAVQGAGAGSLAIASALIMSGSPPEKAGSAAAIEETAYDLGNVLGVAILGSIAAPVYRDALHLDGLTAGLPPSDELATAIRVSEDSLGGAMEVANQAELPELAARAQAAFTDSFTTIGLVGGISLIVMAVVVFALTPRGVDVEVQQH